MNVENRTIFEGDNLHVLRGLDTDTIDLIYLDPPFNSNRTFEAPTESEAAGAAFKDSWTLNDLDSAWHGELAEKAPELYHTISATEFSHGKSMKAYLIMMGIRMLEMYRILKPTGTLYLHCDDNASHYLKIMMDGIFGRDNFRNEIVWQRAVTSKGNLKKGLARDSDLILRYSKSNDFVWNPDAVTIPYDMEDLDEKTKRQYYYVEPGTGRLVSHTSITAQTQVPESHLTYEVMGITRTWRWAESRMLKEIEAGHVVQTRPGNVPRYKRYLDEQKGKTLNNIWVDIPNLTARNKERIGYPTQKPIALLERIIRASSNPGDMVLDPFCGCATTCIAAERLQRHWIGIDLSPKSFKLVKLRLKQHGIVKKVIHQKSNPKLYQQGRTCKHTLFGLQEGRCNGCQMLSAFRNMTIDHIVAKSKGSADTPDNLQLLCGACKLMKGNSTQDQLIQTLKNEGIFQ
jgi:site-specific DNA-methyltransferase (adenine-specific)